MAALNGFNLTSNNDLTPTESINGLVIPAANHVRIYENFTWVCKASGLAHQWARRDAVAVSGTHTESDELTSTSFPTSNESIAVAEVAVRAFASDKLQFVGSNVSLQSQVEALVDEMRNKIDLDVLAAIGGATNQSDNTGSNLSLSLFDAALAAFRAQKPTFSRTCFVGSMNQSRDLMIAIRQAGGGNMLAGVGTDLFNGMVRQGYKGMWQGVEIYEGNTTQADASNDGGGFISAAPMGMWMGPEDIEQGGQLMPFSGVGLAVWRKLFIETERIASRIGTDIVVSSIYGASITADHNARAFISLKAAA